MSETVLCGSAFFASSLAPCKIFRFAVSGPPVGHEVYHGIKRRRLLYDFGLKFV